jgi:hypothetical protein
MENKTGGIGLFGVLGIVFVVLKLIGVIEWSWWLVLLPFYGPLILGIVILSGIALLNSK